MKLFDTTGLHTEFKNSAGQWQRLPPEKANPIFELHQQRLLFMMAMDIGWTGLYFVCEQYPVRIYKDAEYPKIVDVTPLFKAEGLC
jgi:hypothetical protein